ncbi:MAG: hypothetical protein IPP71_08715 [Bacteroidetes bacterium]|nr:hypothetical protein [Bacteroidota bacterium]
MKKQITSLAELKFEIERLTAEKQLKEQALNNQVKELSNRLKPINLIKSTFASFKEDSVLKNQLATKGTEAALGFIVSNLIFKNSNPIVRTTATLIGTAFASKVFGEDSSIYIDKIKNLFEKFKKKTEKEADPSFFEGDIYKT